LEVIDKYKRKGYNLNMSNWNVNFNHNNEDISIHPLQEGGYSVLVDQEVEYESDNIEDAFIVGDYFADLLEFQDIILEDFNEKLEELYTELNAVDTYASRYITENQTNRLLESIESDIQYYEELLDFVENMNINDLIEFDDLLRTNEDEEFYDEDDFEDEDVDYSDWGNN
jgi:hypothetical protein